VPRLKRVAACTNSGRRIFAKIKENITFSTPAVTYKQGARAHAYVKGTLFERQKEESPAECVSHEKKKIRRTHPQWG